jgi:hypothetical protein
MAGMLRRGGGAIWRCVRIALYLGPGAEQTAHKHNGAAFTT